MVPAKTEVAPPVHEDWNDNVEPVASWAEEAAAPPPAATFGTAAVQEDWAAQVIYLVFKAPIGLPSIIEILRDWYRV